MPSNPMVWHYAPWTYLRRIVESRYLLPSNAGCESETPLVWFSANQWWEPTATKYVSRRGRMGLLTFDEQRCSFGCIRFGLAANDLRLLDWRAACGAAGTRRENRRSLEKVGRRMGGSPVEWFGCLTPVALGELRFEVLFDEWAPAECNIEMAQAWDDFRPQHVAEDHATR